MGKGTRRLRRSRSAKPDTREDVEVVTGLLVTVALFGAVMVLSKPGAPDHAPLPPRDYSMAVAAEQAKDLPTDLAGIGRPEDRPLSVLFMGDSLSDAAGATSRKAGFVDLLKAQLREGGKIDAETVALPGQTTTTVAAEMPSGYRDVVLVELGTNDVGRTAVPDFKADYADMLEKVRKESPGALLMCLGPWMPEVDAQDYDEVAKRLCKAESGIYVGLSWAYLKEQYRDDSFDQFHPDDEGHSFIADEVLKWAIPDQYKPKAASAS